MQMRNTFDPTIKLPVTYNKALTTKRMYDIAYDLSRGLKVDYNAQAMSRIDELPGDPKTQANRDTIRAGLSTLGRPTEFHQTLNVNWQIPFNKLRLWTLLLAYAILRITIGPRTPLRH